MKFVYILWVYDPDGEDLVGLFQREESAREFIPFVKWEFKGDHWVAENMDGYTGYYIQKRLIQ